MKWHRIRTMLLHSYFHMMHSMETWIGLFWSSTIQFILFALIGKVVGQQNEAVAGYLLLGFFFWEIIRIAQYSVTLSILWEVWSKSLSSMFVSPLILPELMIAQMISAAFKTILVVTLLGAISAFGFHFSLLAFGPMLIVYSALLLFFAFATGLFLMGLIFRFGLEIQSFAWGLVYVLQPISAVFYPVEALPVQIRWLSYISPITYVMETARHQLQTGEIQWSALGISLLLTILSFIGGAAFLTSMFRWAKRTGAFARLEA